MGWPLRAQVCGSITHVNFHAVDAQWFFFDDVDRRDHVTLCAKTVDRFEWRLLGWVQLGNHGHLLVATPQPNLSAGMQYLTGSYVRRCNQRQGREGALQARRFYSNRIVSQAHLLETLRYLPLNVIGAGLCERPEDWGWSSYRATIGLDEASPYLAVDDVLGLFHSDRKRARELYEAFVLDGLARPARPF